MLVVIDGEKNGLMVIGKEDGEINDLGCHGEEENGEESVYTHTQYKKKKKREQKPRPTSLPPVLS